LIIVCVGLNGCVGEGRDGTPPNGGADAGDEEVPAGFTLQPLMSPATSAVIAQADDGTLRYAYIDGVQHWPMLAGEGRAAQKLPGQTGVATGVALAAGSDGALHLAWDVEGRVMYVRWRDDEGFDAAQTLAVDRAHGATVAVAPGGDVVVAYTVDPRRGEDGHPFEMPRVDIVSGVVGGAAVAFGEVRTVQPACCDDSPIQGPEEVERMSGPSLAVGSDGAVHIVYEWQTFYDTTIQYAHDRDGEMSAPLTVSRAAFVPCPALAVGDDGTAHITFLEEFNVDIWYVSVSDGVVSERQSLYYSSNQITMTMMVRDVDGVMHIAFTEYGGTGGRLAYMTWDAELQGTLEPDAITSEDGPGFIELSARAGGFGLSSDGRLLFGYERVASGGEMGGAEIAFGVR
jgi:hypothetical protein